MTGFNLFRPVGQEIPAAQAPILTTTPLVAPISQPMSNMVISGGISKNVMDWSWLKNLGKVVIEAGIDALKGVLSSQQGNDSIDGVNIGTGSGSSINNIGGALNPHIQGISLSNLLPKESKVDFNFKPYIPKQVKAKPPVYNLNTVDNQADNSFIVSTQQQNQNIKQQQVKPPTERVIDTPLLGSSNYLNLNFNNLSDKINKNSANINFRGPLDVANNYRKPNEYIAQNFISNGAGGNKPQENQMNQTNNSQNKLPDFIFENNIFQKASKHPIIDVSKI